MYKHIIIMISAISIAGCSTIGPPPAVEQKPVLTCDDCSGLVYYGEAPPPAPDARVQMANVITNGLLKGVGILSGVYGAVQVADTIADAGKYVVGPTNTKTTETVKVVNPEVVETDRAVPVPTQIVQPEVVRPEVVQPNVVFQ